MTYSLYNSPGVNINDLLREAHPEGSAVIIDSPTHEGVIEDSIEAQMKAIRMVYKQPVAKVIASLADSLESLGAMDLSEQVDNIGYEFFHEAVLVPAPITRFAAGAGTALMGAIKSAPSAAMVGAGNFVAGPGAMGVGTLAGSGAAGIGTIGIGVVVAAAAGYAAGSLVIEPLLNYLGFTKLIGYLQSLFDETPYAVAIQNIEDALDKSKLNDNTPVLRAEKIIRRAKAQANIILDAPDVEREERDAVGQLLGRLEQLDVTLAESVTKYLAMQKTAPGQSNLGLLEKQFTETKKLIDSTQTKAKNVVTIADNQQAAESAINKLFAPNVAKIQQFKRFYELIVASIHGGKDLENNIKEKAVMVNGTTIKILNDLNKALDNL